MFTLKNEKKEMIRLLLDKNLKSSKLLLIIYDEIIELQEKGFGLKEICFFINIEFNVDITYSNLQRNLHRIKKKQLETFKNMDSFVNEKYDKFDLI